MQITIVTTAAELNAVIDAIADRNADKVFAKLQPLFNQLQQMETTIMATLADVQTAVANETTVEGSVLTLIQQLASQQDPAALQALVTQLNANAQAMADAVTANTPAAPTP